MKGETSGDLMIGQHFGEISFYWLLVAFFFYTLLIAIIIYLQTLYSSISICPIKPKLPILHPKSSRNPQKFKKLLNPPTSYSPHFHFSSAALFPFLISLRLFPCNNTLQLQITKIGKMSYPNYRSTMGSDERDRLLRAQEKPMKTSSIVSTDQAIYCNSQVDRMLRKEKNSMLKQSLEEKIRNLKMACERVKKISCNSKTPANQQNEPNNCAAEKEDIQIRYNFLKPQKQRSTQSSDCSSTKESNETRTSSSQKELKGLNQLTLPTEHLNSLKEVREIDSFVLDEDEQQQQEMSFVEEHGTAVLNWGVCIGRATEFKVLNYIDEGIYGKVYLAQSHRNSAIYSIKSIYRSKMDNNQILQLIREVKIQSFLNHPHIVRLYHFFVDEDCAYLVLQPCLGKNLYHNMKEIGRFPERTVREYVRQICLGVEYMHKNDVLHRDLKPQNILLHQNMIKICDFGWAVHSPLMRGTQCGTPLYTSPEIVSKVPYDSKIDIWSIGILTYEMLYGTIPFEIRNPRDMTKIIQQDVYFPKDASVSDTAKKFMSACLQKNPNDRPTARQLLEHQFMFKEQMFRMTIS